MRARNQLAGCASIPALFAFAFERAVELLRGADIAALQRTPVGATVTLGWSVTSGMAGVTALLDALAQREERARYRLRDPERRALTRELGDGAFDDGRRMLLLALAIDEHFTAYGIDAPGGSTTVVPMPARFLDEIQNPPPQLGQMTPLAVCRRWIRRFWYVGKAGLTGLGRVPVPVARALDERTRQALQLACDEEELRVALVTWRRHAVPELRVRKPVAGCFALDGLARATREGLLGDVIEKLADHRVHIALLPELALDAAELRQLSAMLRARRGRFPVLTVAGLTHQPAASGASHVNEAVILDARGHELLRHEKLEPFTTPDLGLEDVLPRQSNEYAFMDTPVGRIVVNICRDYRSDVPLLLNRLLGASIVLVPAYSKRLDFALEEARILGARQLAMTFASNPLGEVGSGHLEHATAAYVPLRGKAGEMLLPQAALLQLGGDVVVQICRVSFGDERSAILDTGTLLAV